MGIEDQLVGAALDALGWSQAAREHQRANAEAMFQGASTGLKAGLSLREQGIDPKFIEKSLGPEYAAQLMGFEKSDAFKQANQTYQTHQQTRSAIEAILGAPVDAGPHARADQSGPSFEGGRAPNADELTQRFQALPAQQQALYFGPEVANAGLQQRQLEQVALPGVENDRTQLGISAGQLGVAQGNLAVNQGQLALQEAEQARLRAAGVAARRQDRRALIDSAGRTISQMYPSLTLPQLRKAAMYHAGFGTEKSLRGIKLPDGRSLADLPGIVRGQGRSGVSPNALFTQRNEAVDWIPDFLATPANRKDLKRYTPEELDGLNNAKLAQTVRAIVDYEQEVRGVVEPEKLLDIVVNDARVILPDGSAARIVDLPESQQLAKLQLIADVFGQIGATGAAGVGATDPKVAEFTARLKGGSAVPVEQAGPPATLAQPTPAPSIGSLGKQVPGGTYRQGGAPAPIPVLPANPLPRQSGVVPGAPKQRMGRR